MSEQDYLFLASLQTAIDFADSQDEYEELVKIREEYDSLGE